MTTTGHRYTTTSHTDPDGNTIVRTAHQDLGQPAIIEERRYDRTGQEQLLPATAAPGGTSAGGVKRITDLDEETEGAGVVAGLEAGEVYGRPAIRATGMGNVRGSLSESEGEGKGESVADQVQYDSRFLGEGKAYDPSTGAYDAYPGVDSDGVMTAKRDRHHHRVQGRYHGKSADNTGYYASEAGGSGRRVGFEVPETGAILRRESDVNISEVI